MTTVPVPVIDVTGLTVDTVPPAVAHAVDRACREVGFFSVVGHGIDPTLAADLDALAREFFARPESEKAAVAMVEGGTAWRGWFPLHGELTSGTPDHKEGYYFGRELSAADPRVRAGIPLHGPNVWPAAPAGLRPALLAYLDALEDLGRRLTAAISVALGGTPHTLGDRWFRDPVILLRLFRYPPPSASAPPKGVGEHTDYGFLTLLWQDGSGGLEVRSGDEWVEVPPDPGAFVCNLGDMLDRVTGGRYRSTPHRVRSPRRATGCRSRSSTTPTGTRSWRSCRCPSRDRPTTPTAAGTARACTASTARTASTCSARSRRSSPSSATR